MRESEKERVCDSEKGRTSMNEMIGREGGCAIRHVKCKVPRDVICSVDHGASETHHCI